MLPLLITVLLWASCPEHIIVCTVSKDTTIASCPGERRRVKLKIPKEWRTEWELVAPMRDGLVHADAPLTSRPLHRGQKVKLLLDEIGADALPTCEVRVWRRIKKWREGREGERMPMTLQTLPEDCQPVSKK